jgi:TonB family protein
MNSLLNYFIEANVCLLFFIVVYFLGLRLETKFSFNRLFLISALVFSMFFPLFHFQSESGSKLIPSVSQAVPAYLLPEIIITDGEISTTTSSLSAGYWNIVMYIYLTGVFIFSILFTLQILGLVRLFSKVKKYRWNGCLVAESEEKEPTFSFLKFIFIGQSHLIKEEDKLKILQHESVHAHRYHSLDILLINLISIIFWFNPVLRIYKKTLIQLHEFEADEQAVENFDLQSYCNLLARVALQSSDYTLANHFNKSLTLKRIMMMNTIKTKIKEWKLVAVAATFPLVFIFIACQDQVMEDMKDITRNSTMALDYPKEVQMKLEALKKEDPDGKFQVIEFNEEGALKIKDLEKQYGTLPSSISLIKAFTDNSDKGTEYAILNFNEKTNQIVESSAGQDEVFTVVEKAAQPEGGLEQYYQYIAQNLKYPAQARRMGIEGKVFVQFVVNKDGSVSDVEAIKGIGAGCDEEAVRVIAASPKWIPATQRGKEVRLRMVMPITFQLGSNSNLDEAHIKNAPPEIATEGNLLIAVASKKSTSNGKTMLTGNVRTDDGNPIPGANIVVVGNSIGTVSNEDGSFTLQLDQSSGQLAVSFIGYKSQLISF